MQVPENDAETEGDDHEEENEEDDEENEDEDDITVLEKLEKAASTTKIKPRAAARKHKKVTLTEAAKKRAKKEGKRFEGLSFCSVDK